MQDFVESSGCLPRDSLLFVTLDRSEAYLHFAPLATGWGELRLIP